MCLPWVMLMALGASLIQASLYEQAGKTAEQTGYFNAAAKIGMAAVTYGSLGGAQSPAPVVDKSVAWSPT